eukprot:3047575-Prorocentrum_lima.AAC.1
MALRPGGKQSTLPLSSEVQWHFLVSAGGNQSTLPLSYEVQWRLVQVPAPLLGSAMGIAQDC